MRIICLKFYFLISWHEGLHIKAAPESRRMQTVAMGNGAMDNATLTEDPEIRRLEEELRLNERNMNAVERTQYECA